MRSTPALLALPAIAMLAVACGDTEPGAGGPPAPGPDRAPASQWFTDVTAEVGLVFVPGTVANAGLHLPAVMAGGAALLDFDNDGDLDIYLTNAGHLPPAARAGDGGGNRLFRREADGRYTDVTAGSGLGDTGYGMGVAVGDVDNDG